VVKIDTAGHKREVDKRKVLYCSNPGCTCSLCILLLLYYDFVFICAFLWTGHYQPIGVIPEGARNVQIRELSSFKNYLGKFIILTKTARPAKASIL